MALDITSLFAKYAEAADLLITDINATSVVLYYANTQLSSTSGPSGPLNTIDYFGNKAPISDLPNRFDQAGSNVYPSVQPITIQARTYWGNTKYDPNMKAYRTEKSESICKINSFTTDTPKLLNALHAVINGYRVTMTDPPIPYGFGKRYSISYWKISE